MSTLTQNNLRTVRITEKTSTEATEEVVKALLDNYFNREELYFVVRETGHDDNNPHYHIAGSILQSLPGTKASSDEGRSQYIRTKMNRLGWKGNEDFKLTVGDPALMDSHFRYLCKGIGTGKKDGPNIIARHPHFTDAIVYELNQLYWQINAELPKKRIKKRKLNASEEILSMCRERKIQATEHGKIFDQVLKYYCKNVKYLQPIYVKNLVHQTSIYLNPEGNTAACLREFCLANYC